MADQDVISAVAGFGSERLMLKLLQNHELCSNVMALTAICAIELQGNRAKWARVSDVSMIGRRMIARVTLDFSKPPPTLAAIPDSDQLAAHIGQENNLFFIFLRNNPDFIKWIKQVIEKMETYALQKGRPFGELTFGDHGAFMDKDNYIVLELQ